jgi:hypothetical protein
MHGDFTLNPFLYRDDVSRVLWQQGRVQLDSDANEHTEAILRAVRMGIRDIIGPHAGTLDGFRITDEGTKIHIGRGHYYVDGLRASNEEVMVTAFSIKSEKATFPSGSAAPPDLLLHEQPNFPRLDENVHFNRTKRELVYLDVWERHISAAEDDSIREVALMGPDTASRAVVVWQVRVVDAGEAMFPIENAYEQLRERLIAKGRLRARAIIKDDDQACTISPEARYRGPENRLYRVEIHEIKNDGAYFKWATENGSITYPVRDVQGTTITVESLGRDDRTAISIGDYVELVDEDVALQATNIVPPLVQVIAVDRARLEVTVRDNPLAGSLDVKPGHRAVLRRWATPPQKIDRLVPLPTPPTTPWVHLSDGVSIQFTAPANTLQFRVGDYWLIPARTATGDVIWPKDPASDEALFLPPAGVDHHYAPLAQWNGAAFVDLRRTYKPLWQLTPQ